MNNLSRDLEKQNKHTNMQFYIIKGVLQTFDNVNDFEVLEESFFHQGFVSHIGSLDNNDIDISIQYNLDSLIQNDKLEPNKIYSIVSRFKLKDTSCWTDSGYEYDFDINVIESEINELPQKVLEYYSEERINAIDKTNDMIRLEGGTLKNSPHC